MHEHLSFPVLLRADATHAVGVGHAMRLLALSQEFLLRGHRVHLAGDLDVPWVRAAYETAGVVLHPRPDEPAAFVALARQLEAGAVVLDRYDLGPDWGRACRDAGLATAAMVDGAFGADQDADLYVDQNPGAIPRAVAPGQRAVAGAAYTLFRDDVLTHRRAVPPGEKTDVDPQREPLTVLAVFGGTDPMGAAPVITPLLLETGVAMDLTVLSPDQGWGEVASRLPTGPGQTLRVVPPVSDLARRAATCDIVITASGSSVWELLCLGVPIGVVCVIDNQAPGYDMVVAEGLAAGVGRLEALDRKSVV